PGSTDIRILRLRRRQRRARTTRPSLRSVPTVRRKPWCRHGSEDTSRIRGGAWVRCPRFFDQFSRANIYPHGEEREATMYRQSKRCVRASRTMRLPRGPHPSMTRFALLRMRRERLLPPHLARADCVAVELAVRVHGDRHLAQFAGEGEGRVIDRDRAAAVETDVEAGPRHQGEEAISALRAAARLAVDQQRGDAFALLQHMQAEHMIA